MAKCGGFLLWVLVVVRAAGGLPYTWISSGHQKGLLHLRRRRGLLVWSGLVAIYLIVLTIYTRIETNDILEKYLQGKRGTLITLNYISVNLSPHALRFSALWKASKLANILTLISFVQVRVKDRSRISVDFAVVSIILIGAIICSCVGVLMTVSSYSNYVPVLYRALFLHEEIVYVTSIMLTVVTLTILLLEITDLTECMTTILEGQEESGLQDDQLALFDSTPYTRRHKLNWMINTSVITEAKKSLQAMNKAAREVEDYLQIPLLFITLDTLQNALVYAYLIIESECQPMPFILASTLSRHWCVLHAIDIYKNKVRFVFLVVSVGHLH